MAKSTSGTRSPITGALAKAFTKIARAASCVGRLTVDKDLLQLGSLDVEHEASLRLWSFATSAAAALPNIVLPQPGGP